MDFSKFLPYVRDPAKSSSCTEERRLRHTAELDLRLLPEGEDKIMKQEKDQSPLPPQGIMGCRGERVS